MADEQRDDPDGHEVAAMHLALASIAAGDRDKARQILEDALRVNGEGEADDDGLQCNIDHSSGKVQVPRAAGDQYDLREIVKAWAPDISKAYDIVRSEFPAIDVTNKVLDLLHPFVSEVSAEEREKPKPESSTSEIAAGSDAGIALDLRFRNTQSKFRL